MSIKVDPKLVLRAAPGAALAALVACGGANANVATPSSAGAGGPHYGAHGHARGHAHGHEQGHAHGHAHGHEQGHAHGHGHGHGHEQGHGEGGGFHHRFEDAAEWSKVFDDPARDAWQRPARVVGVMEIAPGMTVADVGAGTGYFAPYLSRAVGPAGKVLAEDVEPDMVKWIGERAKREGLSNVEVLLGAGDDPRLPAGSVDRVLVVDTWHHIDDRPAFAKKLATALKPGGAVFVVDFTKDSPEGPPAHARLEPGSVASDLSAAGLSAEIVKDADLPYQYVVRARR